MLEYRPAGLVLLSPDSRSRDIAEQVGALPVVMVGRPARRKGMDTVVNDEAEGARQAIDHLVDLGHRRIAHVSGATGGGARQRRGAYVAAMRARGMADQVRVLSGGFSEHHGAVAAGLLLAQPPDVRPTAVCAANDLVAVGMLSTFEAGGLRVPDHISVVGYDDSVLARVERISLTTINQPRYDMGVLAMRALLARLTGEADRAVAHSVTPRLVVRRSTGPPPR